MYAPTDGRVIGAAADGIGVSLGNRDADGIGDALAGGGDAPVDESKAGADLGACCGTVT
jgi:hypothetical protein